MGEYEIVEGLYYTTEHEWAKIGDGSLVTIGITDYASKLLHEVVYVDLPREGLEVKQMESFGTVESVKAVSELFTPLSGKVTEVNRSLETKPELVNNSPYGDGWLIRMQARNIGEELKSLKDAKDYASLLEKLK